MEPLLTNESQFRQTEYTVESKPKIEVLEEQQKDKERPLIYLSVIKWIVAVLLFFTILFCLVVSKISLVGISERLNNGDTDANSCAFVMLILIMIIPQFITFLRAVIKSILSSKEYRPTKLAIFWGAVSAILEVGGVSLFVLVVIPKTEDFAMSIILMNGMFLFPIIQQTYMKCKKKYKGQLKLQPKLDKRNSSISNTTSSYVSFNNVHGQKVDSNNSVSIFFSILSLLFAMSGFALVFYKYYDNLGMIIAFPISMILLSIAWSPNLLKLQTQPIIKDDDYRMEETLVATKLRMKTARQKVSLITSLIKMILYPLTAFFIWYFMGYNGQKDPGKILVNGFEKFKSDSEMIALFAIQLSSSFFAGLFGWMACTVNLQRGCFVIPLTLTTPIAFGISFQCDIFLDFCKIPSTTDELYWIMFVIGFLFWLSEIFSLGRQSFKPQRFIMAKEQFLFWLPTYNGCLLEQNLLLNRKTETFDEDYINYQEIVRESHIYICTTMYHETDYEMAQLLQSLAQIDQASRQYRRQFEAHVFFDDGARDDVIKLYALQLLSLLKETMNIEPKKAFKLETPYGLQLKWALPSGMPFVLHLKDKMKVKAKKRWSQVMYMSYILDFKQEKARDDLTYILATDADVKFTPADVMALMDLMIRNPDVGAVCGRTHPLGSGPLVWYQIFDYAIGHWLLKVANHVYGSVLCSPGCFSVYRAKAIRDVLPLYSTNVDCAMDFLMKDMGEDRWFCTLMVEAGWKLEYCATAENSTYCPDNFDEFFKQRRRWGPSTFANSIVVVKESSMLRQNNDSISVMFIWYQIVLIVSSIIGPSTVLLVIAGGLQYAYPYTVNMTVVLVILLLVTVIFTKICLSCSQNTQLKAAKMLTFVFAVVMSITIVGILLQTVDDIHDYISPNSTLADPELKMKYKYKVESLMFLPSTWYLLIITGIFIVTAILHGTEALQLIHGIWYLLCLPSGYLLLTIYSVCNLTDRSWGTREGKTAGQVSDLSSKETLYKMFKLFCWCCLPPHLRSQPENENNIEQKEEKVEDPPDNKEISLKNDEKEDGIEESKENELSKSLSDSKIDCSPSLSSSSSTSSLQNSYSSVAIPKKSALRKEPFKRYPSKEELDKRGRKNASDFRFPGEEKFVTFTRNLPRTTNTSLPVEEWMPKEYECYVEKFIMHGYDNVSFIAGNIKEKDLIKMGISNRGHRKKLMGAIERLPPEDLFQEIPENVEDWLMQLGLDEYWPQFLKNSYTEPQDLADLKYLTQSQVSDLFNIKKEGHLRRLKMATSALQYPTKAQIRIRDTRRSVMIEPTKNLKIDNGDEGAEWEFWEKLKKICLLPEQADFNQSGELAEKLTDLRNTSLLVLTVSNVLWITFMVSVMEKTRLDLLGTSFASLIFLTIYSITLFFQFLSMLIHRVETAVHFIARAPFIPGSKRSNWSWRDPDLPLPPDARVLEEIRRKKHRRHTTEPRHRYPSNGISGPKLRSSSEPALDVE